MISIVIIMFIWKKWSEKEKDGPFSSQSQNLLNYLVPRVPSFSFLHRDE